MRSKVHGAILLLLLAVGGAVRIASMNSVARRTPDENIYTWESNAIAERGIEGFRSLVDKFQKDPSLFQYPSPARAGFLWMEAAFARLTGDRDGCAGALFSCVASIATLALLGFAALRWLGPQVAGTAMLLYAISPPVLAMARRSWQEAFVEFLALLILFAGWEAARPGAPQWLMAVTAALIAFSFTIKEIAFVDGALVGLILGVALARRREWWNALVFAGSLAFSFALCVAWLAYLLGGFSILLSFLRQSLSVAGSSQYAVAWQSGSVFEWIAALWISDPVAFTLGSVGLAIAIGQARRPGDSVESSALRWCSAIVLVFLMLPGLSPHHWNIRFVCPVFAPLCLLSGAAARKIGVAIRWFSRPGEYPWIRGFAIAVLLFAAFINYRAFEERFVAADLQDLSLRMMQGR